jgi:hypothetical protein
VKLEFWVSKVEGVRHPTIGFMKSGNPVSRKEKENVSKFVGV